MVQGGQSTLRNNQLFLPVYIQNFSGYSRLKVSDVNGKMLVVSADFFHHLKPKIEDDINNLMKKDVTCPFRFPDLPTVLTSIPFSYLSFSNGQLA